MTQKTSIYSTKNRHQNTSGFSVFWVSGPSILRHSRLSQLASNNRYGRGLRLRHMLRLGGVFSQPMPRNRQKLGCWLSTAPCYPSAGLLDFASWIARICCFQLLVWKIPPLWQLRKLKSSFPKGNFQMFGSFKQANHPWFSNQQP